ncbi:MAG: hypothetical protein AAF610_03680 [Pseudomonadota bacterium]
MRKLNLITTLLLATLSHGSYAASLSIDYLSGGRGVGPDGVVTAELGDTLQFELNMDFSGPDEITLGGGFDINFGPAFAPVDFVFDLVFQSSWLQGFFEAGRYFNGSFGSFFGFTGPDRVGVLTLEVIAQNGLFVVAPSTTEGNAGPFLSAITFLPQIPPDMFGTQVRIVPVPAALWLLLSGLGVLCLRTRPRA